MSEENQKIAVEMTAEEMAEYKAMKAEKAKKEEAAKLEAARQLYKEQVCETVDRVYPILQKLSEQIQDTRDYAVGELQTLQELKRELYKGSVGQQSDNFMSADGQRRIRFGYNVTDNYDDTVNQGIGMVKEYLGSLAKDESSKMMVETILSLLAKDNKGNLKPSRVMKLSQMADKSGDEDFKEGVRIIRDAYRPLMTKLYVRIQEKSASGEWVTLPLSITCDDGGEPVTGGQPEDKEEKK